jgi:hypothetical protein
LELEARKSAIEELEEKEARWREEAMRRQEEVQVRDSILKKPLLSGKTCVTEMSKRKIKGVVEN